FVGPAPFTPPSEPCWVRRKWIAREIRVFTELVWLPERRPWMANEVASESALALLEHWLTETASRKPPLGHWLLARNGTALVPSDCRALRRETTARDWLIVFEKSPNWDLS